MTPNNTFRLGASASSPNGQRPQVRGHMPQRKSWRALGLAALTCVLAFSTTRIASADHPKTAELLPDQTVVFVRIPSIPDFIEKQQNASMGRLLNDEGVRPLVDKLYESAEEEYENVRDKVGLSLDELRDLPQGEFTFAMTGEDDELSVVMFLDIGENSENANILLDSGERAATDDGATIDSETVGDVSLRIINGDETIAYFVRDGLVCITNNPDTARGILARWDGLSQDRGFDKNREFVTIMNRCRPVEGQEAQLQFFVDPIEITRINMSQSIQSRLAYAVVPTMGLDGLAALGGSMTMDTPEFESVFHIHVMMTSPRKGVMNVIAMESGDVDPPAWVPNDSATYMTVNWDVMTTFNTIIEQVDRFQGQGKAREEIAENINEEIGIDFEEDILGGLTGRVSWAQWYEPPVRMNSQTNILGVEVKDPEAFLETVEKIFEKATENSPEGGPIGKATYEGVEYIRVKVPTMEERQAQMRRNLEEAGRDPAELGEFQGPPFDIRTPSPSFGMIDDTFILTDSEEAFRACVRASQDEDASLRGDDGYAEVKSKIRGLMGTGFPGGIMYTKPEESFRFMLGLADSDSVKTMISQGRENDNRAAQIFGDALDEHPLPDFEDLVKYLAPGGGIITDDESGIHIVMFGLKSEATEDE